jgi:pilus assembly protein CpaB
MQNSRLVLIGLAMAVVAALATQLLQSTLGGSGDDGTSTARAVAAARELPAGAALTESDLELVQVPAGTSAADGFASKTALVGRSLQRALAAGQLVRAADISARGSSATLGGELPAGTRAITITLRDNGPEVMLYPGARVDVLATMDSPPRSNGQRETVTRTVLEAARVVAVNDDTVLAPGPSDDRRVARRTTVTLAVSPQDAAEIELAGARGTLGLSLRSEKDGDVRSKSPAEASTRDLFAADDAPTKLPAFAPAVTTAQPTPPTPPTSPRWEVTVIRGEVAERLEFVGAAAKDARTQR